MRGVLVASAIVLVALSGCASNDPETEDTTEPGSDTQSTDGTTQTATTTTGASTTGGTTGTTGGGAANTAPVANLTASATNGTAPLTVTFQINGSDAEGDDLTWTFDADGDGASDANGTRADLPKSVDHVYNATGNATLLVSDGALNHSVTLIINVTAVVQEAVPVDHRECTGKLGTNPVGLTVNNGANSIGGCSLGTIDKPMTVAKMAAVTGCVHDVSPTGSSTGYGTPTKVGDNWAAGAGFRIVCNLGTVDLKGSMDFVPA